MSTNNQPSCFKCKIFCHIAHDCTFSSPAAKKADAGVIGWCRKKCATRDSAASADPTLKVTDNLQSEIKDDMIRLTSGKAVSVGTNFATLGDPMKAKNLPVLILRAD
ncbi:hypothetical protein PoB_001992100 [Plakobranchus ocellatus]|uniref:Uncharacterized protein n=1 Tax=Plakobranchus ocellatus TaxID=259542 RepID=A0AAV3ZFL4_9GAST|nr:hypothetical protein PoB_001992100 [Plakobranchus ocellatus]